MTEKDVYGHVAPMLTVGRGLVSRGHQVTMLTGRKYRGVVESHAMTFLPLPDEVDYDDANLDAWLPGRKQFRGLAASTGGRTVSALLERLGGPLPSNARVDTFLPYDQLLPDTDVMITNGGFGGVQRALSYGVPLVVAGTTEDKPEVAGRVAWSGTGINLRTGTPSPARLRRAARSALADPRYRIEAARLRREIMGAGDPLATVAGTIESLVSHAGPAVSDGSLDEVEPVLVVP